MKSYKLGIFGIFFSFSLFLPCSQLLGIDHTFAKPSVNVTSLPKKSAFIPPSDQKSGFRFKDFLDFKEELDEAKKADNAEAVDSVCEFIQGQFLELIAKSKMDAEKRQDLINTYELLMYTPQLRYPLTDSIIEFFLKYTSPVSALEKRAKLVSSVYTLRTRLNQEATKLTREETQQNIFKLAKLLSNDLIPAITQTWWEYLRGPAGIRALKALAAITAIGGGYYAAKKGMGKFEETKEWALKKAQPVFDIVEDVKKNLVGHTTKIISDLIDKGAISQAMHQTLIEVEKASQAEIARLENLEIGALEAMSNSENEKTVLADFEEKTRKAFSNKQISKVELEKAQKEHKPTHEIAQFEFNVAKYTEEETRYKSQYEGAQAFYRIKNSRSPQEAKSYVDTLSKNLKALRMPSVERIVAAGADVMKDMVKDPNMRKDLVNFATGAAPAVGSLILTANLASEESSLVQQENRLLAALADKKNDADLLSKLTSVHNQLRLMKQRAAARLKEIDELRKFEQEEAGLQKERDGLVKDTTPDPSGFRRGRITAIDLQLIKLREDSRKLVEKIHKDAENLKKEDEKANNK